jgi:hypothetical protein
MQRPWNFTYPTDLFIEGCDVPHWMPYLTAAELGLDRPKLTIDFETSELHISIPRRVSVGDGPRERRGTA